MHPNTGVAVAMRIRSKKSYLMAYLKFTYNFLMKYLILFIVTFLHLPFAFSKCNPTHYSLRDYSESYSNMDLSVACKVKPGDLIDYCNGEVCGYLAYPKAIRDVKLHAKPDLNSEVVGEIKRCDVIKNFKHQSVFKKYGTAEALSDLPGWSLKKGDILNFAWSQEGDYFGCVKNHPVVFYASPSDHPDPSCFVHKTSSQADNWVSHTASNGKTGFSKVESDSFYVGYSGSDERCPEDLKTKN